jgi:zinc protease
VQQLSLANGLKVILVERHALPVVTAYILVAAGASQEPADRNGVATLTARLLSEGTRTKTGAQIAEELERIGASFRTYSGLAFTVGNLMSLTTVFADALALAAPTIVEPSFPEGEFTRAKGETLAGIAQKLARVEGIAADDFARAIFDAASPYARPAEGTAESVGSITRDDVVAWHRRMFAPIATTVLLVGDITAPEARRVVERAFGQWKGTAPAAAAPAAAVTGYQRVASSRVILVDRPGSVQSAIVVGQSAVAATDPDYLPLAALSHVLGGGFRARVNMNLREKHGYTYGAFSQLSPRRGAGTLAVTSSVRTSATDSALVEAVREYRTIATEEIPTAEFRSSVGNLVASFPSSVQTTQDLGSRLVSLLNWGLPLDFYTTYRERLSALTPADARKAARAHLAPDAVTIVVVGDLAKIEAPIRARNLGAVEVWDAGGKKLR